MSYRSDQLTNAPLASRGMGSWTAVAASGIQLTSSVFGAFTTSEAEKQRNFARQQQRLQLLQQSVEVEMRNERRNIQDNLTLKQAQKIIDRNANTEFRVVADNWIERYKRADIPDETARVAGNLVGRRMQELYLNEAHSLIFWDNAPMAAGVASSVAALVILGATSASK